MSHLNLAHIVREANRLDAIGLSGYELHKWANITVGRLLLPVADSFSSPCAFDQWLGENFTHGAERARACITLARAGVPDTLTAFDFMAWDGTLEEHLQELIEQTKGENHG